MMKSRCFHHPCSFFLYNFRLFHAAGRAGSPVLIVSFTMRIGII